mgnify:CR=1 FL=1
MRNIIVTGGNGFIGSVICSLLYEKKYFPIILDRSIKKNEKKSKFPSFDINISKIDRVFEKYKCDTVMHCASSNSNILNLKNIKNYYKQNVFNAQKMLIKCCENNIKNFILISSCSVYGNSSKKLKENSEKLPLSHYGIIKLINENNLKHYSKKNNFNYGILRPFHVTGADISTKNLIGPKIKSKAILNQFLFKNKTIKVKKYSNDLSSLFPKRDYVHVRDVANSIYLTMKYLEKSKNNLILNIGSGKQGLSLPELIKLAGKKFNKKILHEIDKDTDPLNYIIADIEKAKKIIKYKPKHSDINNILKTLKIWYDEKK